jgi:hypothetical protein
LFLPFGFGQDYNLPYILSSLCWVLGRRRNNDPEKMNSIKD